MDRVPQLENLYSNWSQCNRCALCQTRTNVVFGYGDFHADIMIIGEAPGFNEDQAALPFVGKAGKYLDQILGQVTADPKIAAAHRETMQSKGPSQEQKMGVLCDLLWGSYCFTNVIGCRPPEDRTPNDVEIEACAPRLTELIYLVDPILIIAAGKTAAESLIKAHVQITHVRGEFYDIKLPGRIIDYKGLLMATLHPSYLMRKNDQRSVHGETAHTIHDYMKANQLVDEYLEHHHGRPRPIRPAGG